MFFFLCFFIVLVNFASPSASSLVPREPTDPYPLPHIPFKCDILFNAIQNNEINNATNIISKMSVEELCFKHPVCLHYLIDEVLKNSYLDNYEFNTAIVKECNAFHVACALGRIEIIKFMINFCTKHKDKSYFFDNLLKSGNFLDITPFYLSILTAHVKSLRLLTSLRLHENELQTSIYCLQNFVTCNFVRKHLLEIFKLQPSLFSLVERKSEDFEIFNAIEEEVALITKVEDKFIPSSLVLSPIFEEEKEVDHEPKKLTIKIPSVGNLGTLTSTIERVNDSCGMSAADYFGEEQEDNIIVISYAKTTSSNKQRTSLSLTLKKPSSSNLVKLSNCDKVETIPRNNNILSELFDLITKFFYLILCCFSRSKKEGDAHLI